MIQLMNYIKENAHSTTGEIIDHSSIWAGINEYSNSYFKQEISNDLVGFLDKETAELAFELIRYMGKTKFHLNDVENTVKDNERFSRLNLTAVFNALYECGAVGNFNRKNGRYYWKYENVTSSFIPDWHITVHRGLHYALNLKWRDVQDRG
jgi:hypothetical protein